MRGIGLVGCLSLLACPVLAYAVLACAVLACAVLACGVLAGCSGGAGQPAGRTVTRAAAQAWTSSPLTITPDSLGAVTIGMTIKQASAAAGVPLRTVGDGVFVARGGRPRGVSIAGDPVVCVSAQNVTGAPVVRTPQGFPVGGTVSKLKAIYGARLRFLPRPHEGISPAAGYVVRYANGNLAFAVTGVGLISPKSVVGLIIGGLRVVPSTGCA